MWVCLDVPDLPYEQDTGGLSNDDEQPLSMSDTEDEIERLSFVCMLFLVNWLFNSNFPTGKAVKWVVILATILSRTFCCFICC
jgi:hypothetical protein